MKKEEIKQFSEGIYNPKNSYLEQLTPDNIPIRKRVDLLAKFLMENFGDEFGNKKGVGEGAIEMAVRLLLEYKTPKN